MDVAQLSAGIAALILIAVFPVEASLIDRPRAQEFLGIEPHGIRNVHLWSFCIGARNALAGVGTLVGLWMLSYGDASGIPVVLLCLIYMLLASSFMGVADMLGYCSRAEGASRGLSRPPYCRRRH